MSPSSGSFALALDPWRVIVPMTAWIAMIVTILAVLGWGRFNPQGWSNRLRRPARWLGFGLAFAAIGLGSGGAWWLDHAQVIVGSNRLELQDFGARTLDLASLKLSTLRIENLETRRIRAPVGDAGALHLPGYTRGWMTLANGRKAWVMLPAGATKVVFVSTNEPFDLLLGVANPEGLVEALKQQATPRGEDSRANPKVREG